jgi:hypothetical protein
VGVEPEHDRPPRGATEREGPQHDPAPARRSERPLPQPMPTRNVVILAGFVGVLYAGGMIARGAVAAGLVGGILAAILCFLVFREVGERQRRRIRARERSRPS